MPAEVARAGRVAALFIGPLIGAGMVAQETVTATPGVGLDGDRYARSEGFYSSRKRDDGGRELTLFERETLDSLAKAGIDMSAEKTRRNVLTEGIELNPLVGQTFAIGDVLCQGVDLCEPCVRLEQLTGLKVLRPLIGRGGLRARILTAGEICVGDVIR